MKHTDFKNYCTPKELSTRSIVALVFVVAALFQSLEWYITH